MQIGFFTVVRRDPQHFLHAGGLVASIRQHMPDAQVVQFTDEVTPAVEGVDQTRRLPDGPMLERRLEHYAACAAGDWLLLDTDVQLRCDVSTVFDHPFDLALADRHWRDIPQGDLVMHTMPFNTGVCFSRSPSFWQDALAIWRALPPAERDWMSEQRAVYQTIRTGRFRVRILAGEHYNYPPRAADDPCTDAAIVHYKGPQRKLWLTSRITDGWRTPVVAS